MVVTLVALPVPDVTVPFEGAPVAVIVSFDGRPLWSQRWLQREFTANCGAESVEHLPEYI